MMGSFVTRVLIMVFGYAYPAYECYKTVEKNKPGIEQLRFWCQYWILVAVLTISEKFGDAFISWLPMYSEAKLAFFVYLWYPKTRGTTYIYETFLKPYVAKHEVEIDRSLLELRARAGDAVVLYWQRAAIYGQTRFFEILHFVASQPHSAKSHKVSAQNQQQGEKDTARPLPALVPAVSTQSTTLAPPQQQQPNAQPPPSPTRNLPTSQPSRTMEKRHMLGVPSESASGSTKSQPRGALAEVASSPSKSQPRTIPTDVAPSKNQPRIATLEVASSPVKNQQHTAPAEALSSPVKNQPRNASASVTSASSSSPRTEKVHSKLPESTTIPALVKDLDHPPQTQETIMDEAIRVTRGRLRKTRSGAAPAPAGS